MPFVESGGCLLHSEARNSYRIIYTGAFSTRCAAGEMSAVICQLVRRSQLMSCLINGHAPAIVC